MTIISTPIIQILSIYFSKIFGQKFFPAFWDVIGFGKKIGQNFWKDIVLPHTNKGKHILMEDTRGDFKRVFWSFLGRGGE